MDIFEGRVKISWDEMWAEKDNAKDFGLDQLEGYLVINIIWNTREPLKDNAKILTEEYPS